jgi:hypothetical protein
MSVDRKIRTFFIVSFFIFSTEKSPIFDHLPVPAPIVPATEQQHQQQQHRGNNGGSSSLLISPFSQLSLSTPSPASADNARHVELSSVIMCFLADGTEYYNRMTQNAVLSFLRTTPLVRVGLLVRDEQTRAQIIGAIPSEAQRARVSYRFVSKPERLSGWNPTQFKLDVQQFLSEPNVEALFWCDSDVIIYNDLSSFINKFVNDTPQASFYFVPDHVMQQRPFLERWKSHWKFEPFVPQACLMGFRASVVPTLFQLWEKNWRDWITPKPFAKYPDPNPEFR